MANVEVRATINVGPFAIGRCYLVDNSESEIIFLLAASYLVVGSCLEPPQPSPSSPATSASLVAETTAREAADVSHAALTTLAHGGIIAASDQTVARISRVASISQSKFFGVYRSSFAAVGLADATGLTSSLSQGLIASAAGTTGTGYLRLPATIDRTKPFRMSAVIRIGATDDGHSLLVALTNNSDTNYGVTFTASGALLQGNVGGLGDKPSTASHGSPAQGLYEFYVFSDGTSWSCGIRPLTNSPLGSASAVDAPTTDIQRVGLNTDLRFDATNPIWGGTINEVKLSSGSATHEIVSVFVTLGSVNTPSSGLSGAATYVAVLSPTDYDTLIRVPERYDGKTPVDLILVGHPNASDKLTDARAVDAGGGTVHAALLDAGYMLAYVLGQSGSFTAANSSSWGAAAGLATRKAFLDYILATFPQIRNVYYLGQSMGLVDALNFQMLYRCIRAIVGVSGVCNLSYAYSTEGFASVINTAYGSSAVGDIGDHDPCLSAEAFIDCPLQLWHGTSDTTIHKADHPDVFSPLVTAVGGSVSQITVTGGGHLDTAMWNGVSAQTMVAFLQANA